MQFNILDILQVTGALALFIYGMKVMSDGIQKAAGGQLRIFLRSLTKNRLRGILVGMTTTGIVQSSSATTVMTVSLVSAGLLTVMQSASLIMGANIGTTVTAWIVSLGGFLFSFSYITLPILTISIPIFLRAKGRNKHWAEFFIGFSLLFIGLDFLKSSLPTLGNQEVFNFIQDYTNLGFLSRMIFVLAGLVITLVVQSSSAAMTLTLTMAFNGWIGPELAAAMILGENLGTTVTAEIAALVGNRYAKQSARIHTMFNLIGICWMIFFIPYVLDTLESLVGIFDRSGSPLNDRQFLTIELAAFHTSFNLLNTILFVPLIGVLVKIAEWTRPLKKKIDDQQSRYLDRSLGIPELSTIEIQLELLHLGEMTRQMCERSKTLVNSVNDEQRSAMYSWIQMQEERINQFNKGITKYFIRLARAELSELTASNLNTYLSISSDLNRISNLVMNLALDLRDKAEHQVWFTPEQRADINEVYNKLNQAFAVMSKNLESTNYHTVKIDDAMALENEINQLRDEFRKKTVEKREEFDFNLEGSLMFIRMITTLENIGDKIANVSKVMIS